jgi:hypothetical protein
MMPSMVLTRRLLDEGGRTGFSIFHMTFDICHFKNSRIVTVLINDK